MDVKLAYTAMLHYAPAVLLPCPICTVFLCLRNVCRDEELFYMSCNIFSPFNAIYMVKYTE